MEIISCFTVHKKLLIFPAVEMKPKAKKNFRIHYKPRALTPSKY